jgi:hypothetical protein
MADKVAADPEPRHSEPGVDRPKPSADEPEPDRAEEARDVGNQARQRKGAAAAPPPEVYPTEVDLLGHATFPVDDSIAAFLEGQKGRPGSVPVKFGNMTTARAIRIGKKRGKDRYEASPQVLDLHHPLFPAVEVGGLTPKLVVDIGKNNAITGFVGLSAGTKVPGRLRDSQLTAAPELLGLAGFKLSGVEVENKVADGSLNLGIQARIVIGGVFSGRVKAMVVNEAVTMEGTATVMGKGLAQGEMALQRSPEGVVTGKVAVPLALPKNVSGAIDVAWDGQAISGQGKVGYRGEKFSGEVLVTFMEADEAARLEKERKAPPKPEGAAGPESALKSPAKAKSKRGPKGYAVFGEGDLDFAFTEWLTGTAHVIVDAKGDLTVIGKITPQKEFELFKPQEYIKNLFKVEARASYGIPVVGNIFLFANVGLDAVAKLEGVLKNIEAEGEYSTDPEKSKHFTIKGTLNVSAGAGLRLRGEGGAGLEVLDHDIKAGAGVNGIAGVKAYAEATPIIGYRETAAAETEDKKGEFFIRGELEIAGQAFLGLSGDLFVELDSPWWSPAPDKKWTWPLGSKEWPIGGSFGIAANVDYVFGSGKWPSVEFKEVEFSASKFMSDLMNDRTQAKSDVAPQKGEWKEKNTPDASVPIPDGGVGGVPAGGPVGAPPPAQLGVAPGGTKRARGDAQLDGVTAEGQSVKELQAKAQREGKKPKDAGPPPRGAEATATAHAGEKAHHDDRVTSALNALQRLTDHFSKDGAAKEDLVPSVKAVRKHYNFASIEIIDGGDSWDYAYVASPKGKVKGAKKKPTAGPEEPKGEEVFAELGKELGTTPARVVPGWTIPGNWRTAKRDAYRLIFGSSTLPDINRPGRIRMTLGHIVEKSTGGTHSLDNLMPQLNAVNVRLSGIYGRTPFHLVQPGGAEVRMTAINGKPIVGSLRDAFASGAFDSAEQRAISNYLTLQVITPEFERELDELIRLIPNLADLLD